jgi:hypothetical protein
LPGDARGRRPPSRRLSALLIALGSAGGILWMALPGRLDAPASVAELVHAAGAGESGSAEAVAAILALGDAALPDLIEAAARGAFGDATPLSAGELAVVAEALERAPARPLLAYLARLAAAEPPPDPGLRAAALGLAGARGEERDVYLLFDLAVVGGWTAAVEEDLESALADLIRRRPDALDELRGALFALDDGAQRAAVRAVGGAGRARGVGILVDLVGRRAELDSLLLAELARLGPIADPDAARVAALRIHHHLSDDHGGLARAAVTALGRLGDSEPVPEMIELLASDDAGLARTAHTALRELTGLELRAAVGPWRAWYREQRDWSDAHLDAQLDALGTGSPAEVLEALRELSTHPLERHLIAAEAALVLDRPEPALRAAAARALERLRSRAALEALAFALPDPDPTVAAAVHRALVGVVGADLGSDPTAWLAALARLR